MFAAVPAPAEMARWDALAQEWGLPEDVLMENAAREALFALCGLLEARGMPLRGARVLLLMGSGNNGGDAACLARHLQDGGALPLVLYTRPPGRMRGAAGRFARLARKLGVPFRRLPESGSLCSAVSSFAPDIIVDGLLGTGFHGELRMRELNLVRSINSLRRAVLIFSLDIPSGLDGLNGLPRPAAVRAHATVTFQAAKPGLLVPGAREFTGDLLVRPIGMPLRVMERVPASFIMWPASFVMRPGSFIIQKEGADFSGDAPLLNSPRSGPRHKGEAGRVLVVGGSVDMTGAPRLAALGALRAGAGLLAVAAPEGALPPIRAGLPEAVTHALPAGQGGREWHAGQLSALYDALAACRRRGAVVVGPGMGRNNGAEEFLRALLDIPGRPPVVLDADALFALAAEPELLGFLTARDVLTPHPGEAAALLGMTAAEVQADRFAAHARLRALAPACWVLKGEGTLSGVADGPVCLSPWSMPQLAIGGSGDVLAGIAGALLASGRDAALAAALGVEIHARAGAALAKQWPERGNGPREIADAVSGVLAGMNLPRPGQGVETLCPAYALRA